MSAIPEFLTKQAILSRTHGLWKDGECVKVLTAQEAQEPAPEGYEVRSDPAVRIISSPVGVAIMSAVEAWGVDNEETIKSTGWTAQLVSMNSAADVNAMISALEEARNRIWPVD